MPPDQTIPSNEEPVLQRIARTGELKAAARKDATPFSYIDEKTGQ